MMRLRIIFLMILSLAFVAGSTTTSMAKGKTAPTMTALQHGDVIERCAARGLDGKILLVISRTCPHCLQARPAIEAVVEAKGLADHFEVIDTRDAGARKRLDDYRIRVRSVPTLIVDCQVHVGARSKEDYETIIVP